MHIQPTVEFPADFLERADVSEAGEMVEVQAFVAAFGDSGDQRVVAEAAGFGDDGGLELAAEAAGAVGGVDVEGGHAGVVVGAAVGPASE